MLRKILAATGLMCLLVFEAQAQMGLRTPQPRGVWNPVVGAGGVYEVQRTSGEKSQFEMTIVGKEAVEGGNGYWLEMTVQPPRTEGEVILKQLLVAEGPSVGIRKMIMQMPGQPPMEMSGQMMHAPGQSKPQPADISQESQDLGSESVTTPAGTFTCEHYRSKDGATDAWIAKNVPPYGMVKVTDRDSTLTLIRVVTGAKDKITGTPVPFNPMMMEQRPQP